jgi:adenosylhomocysteine nucleosidase
MRVMVLAPMKVELSPVVRTLGLTTSGQGRAAHSGRVDGVEVTAALAGVGPAQAEAATRWALETFHPDHVIVSGIAGGMAGHLRIGDLVTPAETVSAETGRVCHPVGVGHDQPAGRIVTTAALLAMAQLETYASDGAVAVDMETAAVGEVCEDAGVAWTAYRGISDLVSEGLVDDRSLSMVKPDGTTNVAEVVKLMVTKPWVMARMARLGRDTQRATTAAAQATATAIRSLAPSTTVG